MNHLLRPTPPALVGMLLATSAPCMAQNDTVLIGPEPAWIAEVEPLAVPADARGVLFLRRQQTEVRLSGEGQETFARTQVKLLHASALQLGNIGITWNPAAGAPTVHALRIHRGDEQIDVLANSSFEVLRREDQLEAAWIDGLLTASLRVPDLRIGDELEVAFTVPSTNPSLPDRDSGVLALAAEPAPGRVHLRLSWDEAADEPRVRLTDDLAGMTTRADRSITISADSAPVLSPPRDAPPRYRWQRVLEYSDFPSWQAVSQRFAGLFAEARDVEAGSPVAAEAARIARANEGDLARASAALQLVTQQVRYIYVGLNTGAMTPASAAETWERRYGDCKGKTALLLALLDELGIEAQAVVVNTVGMDDGLDRLLPTPGAFDHVLVRARIDGRDYWLDGTMPDAAIPSARPLLPYRHVLPLTASGADLERLEWQEQPVPLNTTLYEIDASAGFDSPAAYTQTVVTRGIGALAEYAQFSALTDSQLEDAFRRELVGSTGWDSIEDVRWRFDRERQASILEIVGTSTLEWRDAGNSGHSLILPGGGFNPPGRHQREAGQDQSAPYANEDDYSCHVTTVRLPGDTQPDEWSFNSTFDTNLYGRTYRRTFERKDDTIRMLRVSRVEEPEISSERAARDNARLPNFDNTMARIEHDPADSFTPRAAMRVPATWERDWVIDPSACDPDSAT